MGELDVEAMLSKLTREQFNRWYVAYHELHLDGSGPAAILAATLHNELGPLHWPLNQDWKPETPADHLPAVDFSARPADATPPSAVEPDWADVAARAWG